MKRSTIEELVAQCPQCEEVSIEFPERPLSDLDGCTTDCEGCGTTLVVEGNTVFPLHERIHSQDHRWPADGHGTGTITIIP